jgi:phosphonopyruvate decarboxylase
MPLVESLRVLHAARRDEIVVTSMGTAREWMTFEQHPLDFVLVPSSMGQAPAFGLGLALACPERSVIVCNGDGSTLMNLGSLVSMTAEGPANLTLLLYDNGVYEVTGAQPTPGSAQARRTAKNVDFTAMARACGFASVFEFRELDAWKAGVRHVIDAPGPTFAWILVDPQPGASGPRSPGPGQERAVRFAEALKAAKTARPPAAADRRADETATR